MCCVCMYDVSFTLLTDRTSTIPDPSIWVYAVSNLVVVRVSVVLETGKDHKDHINNDISSRDINKESSNETH